MLTPDQINTLQEIIGHELDQAHDYDQAGGEDEYLREGYDTTADELIGIAAELEQATLTAEYIQAARHLVENLADELPEDVQSGADARAFEQVLSSHLWALSQHRQTKPSVWLVPAPYGGTAELAPLADVPYLDYGLDDGDIPKNLAWLGSSEALGRVMLAAGSLYARGYGMGTNRLAQCVQQALVWERG